MPLRFAVILNPIAHHGRAGRQRRSLERALDASGLDYVVHVTGYPGHAVEQARELAARYDVVVAAGGDGTVNEVSRGLIQAGGASHLGLVPIGTGNDFTKMIGVPPDVDRAVEVLARLRPRPVDYGRFRWWERGRAPAGSGTFVNAIGMGFDARVAAAAARYKALPGATSYAAAIAQSLWHWRAPCGHVWAEGELVYRGRLFLATTSNGRCSGGGFYLTPGASVTDGHLDLLVIEGLRAGRVVQLLPRVLWGRHTTAPEVHLRRARHVRVVAEAPLLVHADGEVVARPASRLEVDVVPGGLSVLHP